LEKILESAKEVCPEFIDETNKELSKAVKANEIKNKDEAQKRWTHKYELVPWPELPTDGSESKINDEIAAMLDGMKDFFKPPEPEKKDDEKTEEAKN